MKKKRKKNCLAKQALQRQQKITDDSTPQHMKPMEFQHSGMAASLA